MNRGLRVIGLGLAPFALLLAQHGGGGGYPGGGHGGGAYGSPNGFGLSPIAPFHAPPSVGLSPPSFGVNSANSFGFGATSRPYGGYPAHGSQYGYGNGYGRSGGYRHDGYGRNNRRYVVPFALFGGPFYSPYDYGYDNYGDYEGAEPAAPPPDQPSPEESQLGAQVAQLSAQINDLQNQLGRNGGPSGPEPQPPAPAAETPQAPAPSPAGPPVTVVLNDGKTLKVQSYAVVGNTFWDLTSQPARKIAVSKINVPASTEATEAAGAEFPKLSGR